MWSNRLNLEGEATVELSESSGGAFIAFPLALPIALGASSFCQQLYHWAYEQARETVLARRTVPQRDLFAILN
jgi:hypothetical protein